jgi:PiT family inorganic phosphate transporter
VATAGWHAVKGQAIVEKVLAPALLAPIICGAAAMVGTLIAYRMLQRERTAEQEVTRRGYRYGQVATASLVSLAHGTNDAQKTMGVITLALVAHGTLHQHGASDFSVPLYYGYPLSTTHVVSGGILGVGVGKRLAEVRWGLAGQIAGAWALTLPAAGAVAYATFWAADHLAGGVAGPVIMAIVAAVAATSLFAAIQRRSPVTASDVA